MLSELIHRMIDDAFRLTLDLAFPPLSYADKDCVARAAKSSFPLSGYTDEENLWGEAFYEFRIPV